MLLFCNFPDIYNNPTSRTNVQNFCVFKIIKLSNEHRLSFSFGTDVWNFEPLACTRKKKVLGLTHPISLFYYYRNKTLPDVHFKVFF